VAIKKQTAIAGPKKSIAKAKRAGNGSRRPTVTPSRKAKSSTPSATQIMPALNTDVIGNSAGKVWGSLADHGAQSLAELKKSVGASNDVVLAALGWLAREDKLEFSVKGRAVVVALRGDN
jgi:hypothetical protein